MLWLGCMQYHWGYLQLWCFLRLKLLGGSVLFSLDISGLISLLASGIFILLSLTFSTFFFVSFNTIGIQAFIKTTYLSSSLSSDQWQLSSASIFMCLNLKSSVISDQPFYSTQTYLNKKCKYRCQA